MVGSESQAKPLEMREVFGQTLLELGQAYPQMIVLDADLHTSSKATYFKKAFPDRFIPVSYTHLTLPTKRIV